MSSLFPSASTSTRSPLVVVRPLQAQITAHRPCAGGSHHRAARPTAPKTAYTRTHRQRRRVRHVFSHSTPSLIVLLPSPGRPTPEPLDRWQGGIRTCVPGTELPPGPRRAEPDTGTSFAQKLGQRYDFSHVFASVVIGHANHYRHEDLEPEDVMRTLRHYTAGLSRVT